MYLFFSTDMLGVTKTNAHGKTGASIHVWLCIAFNCSANYILCSLKVLFSARGMTGLFLPIVFNFAKLRHGIVPYVLQLSLYFTTLYFKTTLDYKTAWFGPKGQYSVLNDLYFNTSCYVRPHFLCPMGGLKIEGPMYWNRYISRAYVHSFGIWAWSSVICVWHDLQLSVLFTFIAWNI